MAACGHVQSGLRQLMYVVPWWCGVVVAASGSLDAGLSLWWDADPVCAARACVCVCVGGVQCW